MKMIHPSDSKIIPRLFSHVFPTFSAFSPDSSEARGVASLLGAHARCAAAGARGARGAAAGARGAADRGAALRRRGAAGDGDETHR